MKSEEAKQRDGAAPVAEAYRAIQALAPGRLVHSHSGLSPDKDLEQLSHQGLDRRRLTRVSRRRGPVRTAQESILGEALGA